MPILTIKEVYKSFGETKALKGVSFDVSEGEIVTLLGPSGCGKSTLLGLIAGLIIPDSGEIFWDGKPLSGIPVHKRGFGLMFQDYALFPHMNVYKNIAFGLRFKKGNQGEVESKVQKAIDLVGLRGFEKRDISTLSGGEQQRVALARSIAPQPRLLMLDEPLGSLDRNLRERLIFELSEILRSLQLTAIYVTHDQEEAFAIADCVVLMREGKIEQIGTPQEIYQYPASLFAARFLGLSNLLPGSVIKRGEKNLVSTEIGDFPVDREYEGRVTVLIRPDLVNPDAGTGINLHGEIFEKSFRGNLQRVIVDIKGTRLQFNFPSTTLIPDKGNTISLRLDSQKAVQILTEDRFD